MTDFANFEPSAWIEDGVLLAPIATRRQPTGTKRVYVYLQHKVTAAAVSLSVAAVCLASDRVTTADGGVAMSPAHQQRRFATPSDDGEIDPRIWGQMTERLKEMRSVSDDVDFDDPDPFT